MPNKLNNDEMLIDCDTVPHIECSPQRIWGTNKQGICSCLSPYDYTEKPQHPDLNGVYLIVINGCSEEYKNLFGNTKNGQSSLHPRFMSRNQVKFNCSSII